MSISYEAKIEGLLFVAGANGISLKELSQALNMDKSACVQQVERLKDKYEVDSSRGITILLLGENYKLVTKQNLKKTIENYAKTPAANRLSQASIETLAIIAYRQPISRGQIDEIRGVQSQGSLQTLVVKRLIEEKGRFDGPGRAILYGTTAYFLDYFGLESLDNLPEVTDLDDLEDKELPNLFNRNKEQGTNQIKNEIKEDEEK